MGIGGLGIGATAPRGIARARIGARRAEPLMNRARLEPPVPRAVVTGATSGIGQAAVLELARGGWHLVLLGRDAERLAATQARAEEAGARGVETVRADFTRLQEVEDAAQEVRDRHEGIDALLLAAGGYWPQRHVTRDGFERTFQVNHLAHHLLARRLLPRVEAAEGRIVVVASQMQRWSRLTTGDLDAEGLQAIARRPDHNGVHAYADSKLLNIAHAMALARRMESGTANAVHPGFVRTRIYDRVHPLARPFVKLAMVAARSPEKGAETPVWLCDARAVCNVSGRYWIDKAPHHPRPEAEDRAFQAALWAASERWVGEALARPS